MSIKKFLLFIVVFVLTLGFSSCMSLSSRIGGNEREVAEKRLEEILKLIEAKDAQGIKALFSQDALEKTPDLDEGILQLINFYQGTMQEHSVATETSTDTHYGAKREETTAYCSVTTDQDIYEICFSEVTTNNQNSKEKGLYMIEIIRTEDCDKDENFRFTYRSGVYVNSFKDE